MSNMSYCRFQNTNRDLDECADSLENLARGEEALSDDEIRAAKEMCRKAFDIVQLFIDETSLDFNDVADDLDKHVEATIDGWNATAIEQENTSDRDG